MSGNKRTPLYAVHKALGARLIPFGGWEMPVEYSDIAKEHTAVRTAAGFYRENAALGPFWTRIAAAYEGMLPGAIGIVARQPRPGVPLGG